MPVTYEPDQWNAVAVERDGLNVLIMRKCNNPIQRADGKIAQWELEYRWLSQIDPALCCVQGNEYSYWQTGEWDRNKSLFEQFDLF